MGNGISRALRNLKETCKKLLQETFIFIKARTWQVVLRRGGGKRICFPSTSHTK